MKKYAIAFDIGTTTITGGIIDLAKKKSRAVISRDNPQQRFGEDVVSRLDFCLKNRQGLASLRKAAAGCMNSIIKDLTKKTGVKISDIEKAAIAGNTAMEHFFLKIDPAPLAEAPYASSLPKGIIEVAAGEVGLALEGRAKVYLLPIVKSFVGSDLTAGVLYVRLAERKGANLLIDIGTNGEIALAVNGKLFVASTAAGPAFENGLNMAGSDVIETTARMLKNGIIDRSGRIKNASAAKIGPAGIRKVQVAKAAIMAGMQAVVKKAGIDFKDISSLYVAGKFGNYINKRAAMAIGLLPKIEPGRIKTVGNAAYKGAGMSLYSKGAFLKLEAIADKAVHVGLFGSKDFKEEFVKNMGF